MNKKERLKIVNELIGIIASCGRKFFAHNGKVSHMELDARGRVWFVDSYSGRRIYTHSVQFHWRGFSEGGTLRSLVIAFTDYICNGTLLRENWFGPWPQWYCTGDPWGYGDDMKKVRQAAARLELMATAKDDIQA